ncbi:hypothetical protein BS50DRAFT_303271 [Corynespora cassiicola Philippines]|uniref:Uncharacterized protein n=1 Tax=Corynespora cassiicola Philippines TaxID=1448308 RepID=A0A2T2NXP5_CORCC|nr:hypothetical protein BS50DRAFT_303271 [Corynespora cassiicola Philippines]
MQYHGGHAGHLDGLTPAPSPMRTHSCDPHDQSAHLECWERFPADGMRPLSLAHCTLALPSDLSLFRECRVASVPASTFIRVTAKGMHPSVLGRTLSTYHRGRAVTMTVRMITLCCAILPLRHSDVPQYLAMQIAPTSSFSLDGCVEGTQWPCLFFFYRRAHASNGGTDTEGCPCCGSRLHQCARRQA